MYQHDRTRPRVAIPFPPGAQPLVNPSSGYSFQITPAEVDEPLSNPWDSQPSPSAETPRPRAHSMHTLPPRLPSEPSGSSDLMPFPEPQIYRSVSAMQSGQSLVHRNSRSELGPSVPTYHRNISNVSFTESYYPDSDEGSVDVSFHRFWCRWLLLISMHI